MIPLPLITAGISAVGGLISNRQNNKAAAATNAMSIKQANKFFNQTRAADRKTQIYERGLTSEANAFTKAQAASQKRMVEIARKDNRDQFRASQQFAESQAEFAREQWEYSKQDQVTETDMVNRNYGAIDVKKLHADAERSGFNPMTLLATGAYGISRSTQKGTVTNSGGSQPVGSVAGPSGGGGVVGGGGGGLIGGATGGGSAQGSLPVLASPQVNNVLGDAVGTYFNALASAPDPEREVLEKNLMRAELQKMQEPSRAYQDANMGYSIPHVVQTSGIDPANVSGSGRTPSTGSDPTLFQRGDGFTSGAMPGEAPEAEVDLWNWARNGKLFPNLWDITKLNVPSGVIVDIPQKVEEYTERRDARRRELYESRSRDPFQSPAMRMY